MEIRNLQEISPYIRLFRQETENNEQSRIISPVEGSDNGVDWHSLDKEIQGAFQIYRLFDPVFILPKSKLESDESDESDEDVGFPTSTSTYVEGYYNVHELSLPDDVKKLFDENNDNIRRIAFSFDSFSNRNGTKKYILNNMVQKDFPPFSDTITLAFSDQPYLESRLGYWPRYGLEKRFNTHPLIFHYNQYPRDKWTIDYYNKIDYYNTELKRSRVESEYA